MKKLLVILLLCIAIAGCDVLDGLRVRRKAPIEPFQPMTTDVYYPPVVPPATIGRTGTPDARCLAIQCNGTPTEVRKTPAPTGNVTQVYEVTLYPTPTN